MVAQKGGFDNLSSDVCLEFVGISVPATDFGCFFINEVQPLICRRAGTSIVLAYTLMWPVESLDCAAALACRLLCAAALSFD